MARLGHAAGVDARDQGEGHHALPAEDLPVRHALSDHAAVEAAGAAVPCANQRPGPGHQARGDPSSHDSADDLERDVDHGVDDRVEAADRRAEAHSRVQVTSADVRRDVDPHGQGEAVHEGRQLGLGGASQNLEEHHAQELHGQGHRELPGEHGLVVREDAVLPGAVLFEKTTYFQSYNSQEAFKHREPSNAFCEEGNAE